MQVLFKAQTTVLLFRGQKIYPKITRNHPGRLQLHLQRYTPSSCAAIKNADGLAKSGVYVITPNADAYYVFCDQVWEGGGGLVFASRTSSSFKYVDGKNVEGNFLNSTSMSSTVKSQGRLKIKCYIFDEGFRCKRTSGD